MITADQALQATLLSLAVQHAQEEISQWESLVEGTLHTIARAEAAAPKYKWAFASDLRAAKRRLPKEKKTLALWRRRLKLLKGRS